MSAKLKGILIALLLVVSVIDKSAAYGLSYVYIQGDKQTPFYVKLEGEMQPRYGKNYCIIPKLAPGPIHVEILFQQNAYPAEKFTIIVPENGYRGFMLTKKGGAFSLYDLQQAFYLQPGNTEDDDVAPVVKQLVPTPTIEPAPVTTKNTSKPVKNNTSTTKTNTVKPKPIQTENPVTKTPENGEPNFISNIELTNERTFGSDSTVANEVVTKNQTSSGTAVSNSDCPKPMTRSDYEDLLRKARNKSDNNRLKYLLEQTDNCYSTIQLRALARSLTKDPERYAFLKQVYPRTTDQVNFPTLESTLISKEWKSYFRLILE